MKVTLLYRDREWGKDKSYFDREEICKDLNLNILFRAASSLYDEEEEAGLTVRVAKERDEYISEMLKKVMLTPLLTEQEVYYRQQIIKEALNDYDNLSNFYGVVKDAMKDIARFVNAKAKQGYGSSADQGRRNIANVEYLEHMVNHLDKVVEALSEWKPSFVTPEMGLFADAFFEEYNEEYMTELRKVVSDLRLICVDGILELSASIGTGLSMSSLVLRNIVDSKSDKKGFLRNAAAKLGSFYKDWFYIKEVTLVGDDQNLLEDIAHIKDSVLGTMMQFFQRFLEKNEHFFKQLYCQTAFLMGAANLYRRARGMNVDCCFPMVVTRKNISFSDLVELSLAMSNRRCPVANSLSARDKHLLVVTGANQGGKSTYLRSIGIAQIMLQCGMFVSAKGFSAGLYSNVFTHFTRREDSAMNSGRLDEELGRMERIIDHITPDSVLFLNESFATTTEKEGSIIAGDITTALYERGIRVMMVTHLLAFAQSCYAKNLEHAIFLSAEREKDGRRTYRMIEQEPELTSYGLDLYDEVLLGKK